MDACHNPHHSFLSRLRRGAALFAPNNFLTSLNQTMSAFWTRGMRLKPLVDTTNMESMVTLGQQSELVSGNVFRQAYNTFSVKTRQVHLRRVGYNWESLECFLLDSCSVSDPGGGGIYTGFCKSYGGRTAEGTPYDVM